jgi:hypothetical protein
MNGELSRMKMEAVVMYFKATGWRNEENYVIFQSG